MTHAEQVHRAVVEVATKLPGFDELDGHTQQILLELGEEYFGDEFLPRLQGIVNVPRYQEAMHEKTEADRIFIEDQIDFLNESIAKARTAAHDQLLEKYTSLTSRQARKR